ncbi:M4 family metallopeptidase [Beggiatoa leptomitoformis]|uniref:Peptidase M4 family protein n=1 Tax=Beggiatoa leptomitoformis TaxID=288004 RepID=A0A2N9YIB8_9GAMM|nr:M4 family metallopeptidase [Beggiatoa leptomitoformis]AUI69956.1 peptidase M4 family protein [Beggiatoa leptomitoformis]QGX03655.1 peptidase M4 family protein [Beggiatoa leptomitoformis]
MPITLPNTGISGLVIMALLTSAELFAATPNELARSLSETRATLARTTRAAPYAPTETPLKYSPLYSPLRSSNPINIQWNKNGTPREIKGGILQTANTISANSLQTRSGKTTQNETTARDFLRINRFLLKIQNPDQEFALHQVQYDTLNSNTRLRFTQQYAGLEVWPAEIGVRLDAQGNVVMMNGIYAATPRHPLNVTPQISAEQARNQVMSSYPVDTQATQPVLIIYATVDQEPRLAWRFQVLARLDQRIMVVVDALSAKVLAEFNQIHGAAVTGSGQDLTGQVRTINVFEKEGRYVLNDTSKPMFAQYGLTEPDVNLGTILIYDAQHADAEIVQPSILSSTTNNNFLADGVSAAYNISEVYDYFLQKQERNSINGQGGSIIGIVRVGENYDNAFWNGSAMYFGDARPYAASSDVVGHELTHGVVEYSAGLVYEGQSGALNEAFADIFGEMTQTRTQGQPDWIIGGQELGVTIRSFTNPEAYDQPSTMSSYQTLPNTEDGDNGGVHINSGIINHAFYLLSVGLNDAIGTEAAAKIFYRALTQYLTRNSQFTDARLAAINAAHDLYGQNAIEAQKVAEAFDAVGLLADNPTTPSPTSFNPVSEAPDALLSACLTSTGDTKLCRYDTNLGDTEPVILSTSSIKPLKRVSIQGDGSMAVFINANDDLCFIEINNGQEACAGFDDVHSVTMSPDGNRYALTFYDNNYRITNQIVVIDLTTNEANKIFTIKAPALDGSEPTDTISGVDTLVFSSDSKTILFDAQNLIRTAEGETIGLWGIYSLNINSSKVLSVVKPTNGQDIGFPHLSKTSDNFITYDIYNTATDKLQVHTLNLNNGKDGLIAEYVGSYSFPTYNGDDSSIVYMMPDENALFGSLGYQLITQHIATDRLTPQGEPQSWLNNTGTPNLYRQGTFVGQLPVAAYFDLQTSVLRAWVTYADQLIQGDMKLVEIDSNGFWFQLLNAQPTGTVSEGVTGTLTNDILSIPRASITNADGNTSYWNITLQLHIKDGNIYFYMPNDSMQATE